MPLRAPRRSRAARAAGGEPQHGPGRAPAEPRHGGLTLPLAVPPLTPMRKGLGCGRSASGPPADAMAGWTAGGGAGGGAGQGRGLDEGVALEGRGHVR